MFIIQQFTHMEDLGGVQVVHMQMEEVLGGYPAAGIGGGGAGGAGGKDPVGGGGFTGGNSECNNFSYVRHNGLAS